MSTPWFEEITVRGSYCLNFFCSGYKKFRYYDHGNLSFNLLLDEDGRVWCVVRTIPKNYYCSEFRRVQATHVHDIDLNKIVVLVDITSDLEKVKKMKLDGEKVVSIETDWPNFYDVVNEWNPGLLYDHHLCVAKLKFMARVNSEEDCSVIYERTEKTDLNKGNLFVGAVVGLVKDSL